MVLAIEIMSVLHKALIGLAALLLFSPVCIFHHHHPQTPFVGRDQYPPSSSIPFKPRFPFTMKDNPFLLPMPQQTPILASARDEPKVSFSSESSSHSATSLQSLSPRSVYPGPRTASIRVPASGPFSVVGDGADHFSPDLWVILPEERALMTNSAHFARDRRRRRGAVHLDAPLELPSSLPSSLAPCSAPHSPDSSLLPDHRIVCVPYGEETSGITSPIIPDTNRAPPRGRLERSFTPSERKGAGIAIVPGLLRRLGRPFSGPWRGPSSPLAPVSGADAPPAGPLSRLRRVFSCRRKD